MALTISRYGEVSPTEIHSSGIAVSTPIYITLTSDQRKALLNRFRQIKQEQLATTNCLVDDPGEASKRSDGTDAQATGLTLVEDLLGVPEEHLRYGLFSRNGMPERLVVSLQRITGLELVNRREIEATVIGWLDYLFESHSNISIRDH